ncbi:uncharacterized protein MONOS_9988 [Monocercomonoides exilis]|uniref:uncharacterized protein n=1 Tax=Monocercomonoides exilis TaxID=2049356 RepID=UPI003559AB18|nr:hypothetical protein MONOS_9988 [Monocercomonoides exilis]|eukprot:MONOS_9988.1-p1 / transcript=MONOS_9988.1 / gene=MONOS_9988 / organism=Monocercomonoides_exilis_PA203 / gene_product=unspecified product / transcript_product=unspecified product / location=Mono_scaffold00434:22678-29976(-) / protein_length=2346 / sequence_SO=supercontig / SO=protein_coding / is_pseudo=false
MTLIPQMNVNPSSLVFSSDNSNIAILRNSIISDLAVSSSDNFLVSGKSHSEQINDCSFRNMSVKSCKKSDYYMEHSCFRSSMENCLIYSCVNAFEGGISSGSHSSHEFICRNTTVSFGKREMNALQKKGQMNLTDSQSFSLCEWTDCTAPQGGALYVHDNENAILTVENCSFTRCNASSSRGGGIYALKIAECIVLHSTFDQCVTYGTTDWGGGGIQFETIYIQPMVDDCYFNNCSAANDGGGISGHDIALHDSTSNNIDPSCYSTRQSTNRVSSSYSSLADRSDWLRNDFGVIRFVSSTTTEPNAKDTFACGLDESHPCCTISRCVTQLIPGLVPKVEVFLGTIKETRSVDCSSNTFTIYGQSDLSSTIQTEFEASGLSLFSVSTGTLTARDFVLVHDSVHTNNRGSRLFEITETGEMHISGLNISAGSGHSAQTAFTTELINVQSGMFQMENVNWEKTISTTSLFSLSSTNEISLTLSECTFSGIERTTSGSAVISFSNDKVNANLNSCSFSGCGSTESENGGSMKLFVGNENEVKVNGGSFDECYCSVTDGLGGGILLRLLNENPNFLISSSFGTNTAKWGRDIFVISPNLEVTAKSQNITCVTASLNSVDRVRGYDNGNNSVAIPLCIYLLPTPEEIFVSNIEASNHSRCGIVQFPCLTMKHSLTRQTGTKKVNVNGMILMSDELTFEGQKHEIRGNDDQSGWSVSDSSETSNSAMITTRIETELSKLIFSLPPSLSSHSTFISSFSQLTLSHCSISLQDPLSELTFLFLSVESGILTIDKFSASSIDLRRNSLISLSGSGIKAELMSTLWLNMTNSNFTEIERTTGNGGCISFDNSDDENTNTEINIEKCDFDECSVLADESRGGALNVQMKRNTQLNIISCTFIGCTAPAEEEKTGFGGGMALKLIDDDSLFVISSPVFDSEKPNVAKYGNDLFVESSNLTKSITNTSLPFVSEHLADISLDSMRGFDGNDTLNAIPLVYFWFAIGSEIFIGGNGKDVCTCGFSDYPCLSIDYSMDRLPEGNEKNINIIEKAILKKCVDASGISIKSDDNNQCVLECLSSLEVAEDAAMKISGISNLELIDFIVPSSFTGRVNFFIHVDSSEGLLTVKYCSFTKMEESGEEIISIGLIKADGGTVQLELVTIQSLCFSHDVISVLSTTILNVKNLTMKNVELEGASGLSISKSSRRETNEEEQDIVIEWSLFEEVTQNATNDIPIIWNEIEDEPLKIVTRNTTMKKCGGTKCGKGGGMFSVLNEGGKFDCSFCTISECFCSSTGRGGWLFLECTSTAEHPLKFLLLNITFKDNSAFRGRDVYVKCYSIDAQIVEEQFLLDFRTPFVKDLAIWGATTDSFVGEEDLLLRVVKYQSETIFVSSVADNHADSKQCGELSAPCHSLDIGVQHIIPSSYSQLLISEETIINGECDVHDVIIRSLQSPSTALVHLNSTININEGGLITTSEKVRFERLKFNFGQSFSYSGSSVIHEASGQLSLLFVNFSSAGGLSNNQPIVFINSTLLTIVIGILHVDNCLILMLSFKKPSFLLKGDEISMTNVKMDNFEAMRNVFVIDRCKKVVFNGIDADGVKLSDGCIFSINDSTSGTISIGSSSFNNCSRNSEGTSVLTAFSTSAQISLSNCSCSNCCSMSGKGSVMKLSNATNVSMDLCRFVGVLMKESKTENMNAITDICQWSGSLVHSTNSTIMMKYVTISNASSGGLSVSAGNVTIEKGEFLNNNPFIEKYPSLRRNIICSESASLTISSLKGGDGVFPNLSLWILDDGCTLGGMTAERSSPFFISKLEEVSISENDRDVVVKFEGSLFVPCDLSFRLVYKTGDVELAEIHQFEKDGFVSETEVIGIIPSENISKVADETEVSVMILFGKQLAATSPQILKNKTESKPESDKAVERGKEGKSYWLLIVIALVVILLIVLTVSIIFIVRWRKQKRRTEELEEIVNDTVKKDPKLMEMVTMEISPEEQWRRAERETEKKNEERMKKRVYAKSLGHSESSEHLLSESGSTENILGRDSDKIPDWVLEKVDEEEIRKRTPSPSISSTCSTDSDSTFVRGEDLCPTTSSMSNLVDAMACSSPHEKLIVDLRDSLFMLLHGRNEKKEMAIGTFQEREYTAVQILFWVANLALHSFDEMDNPLQSLANLSPHIVLFSEHMVICIVMHSDFLSDDDSDSSSISSSTVVTSASDDESDSLPSSAFEDEDDFKKECLRWKSPELQINKKMGATKESVAFSIGMMLWECLTLQIPFGDYEAETAGQKIINGERPNLFSIETTYLQLIKRSLATQANTRPTLIEIKRIFISHAPAGAVQLTMSDAIDLQYYVDDKGCSFERSSSLAVRE